MQNLVVYNLIWLGLESYSSRMMGKSKVILKAVLLLVCRVGKDIQLQLILESTLHGVSGQCHATVALYPEERTPGTHWLVGWVGLRAGLDTENI
jgi:hypothetical protein